ncbi:nucleotide exchange factor Fes1-domain-containing protein [Echria macrotheca]|uniref:Nucleotide exchange factor Fes1-domain-containing protein n=1 Tax=Echria macrotheca TaxID=438768 RepID=A0AAJ0BLI1_9PEZI|nr:nucleotide exchange factor Fes1-domain-containing protein [Echria macrotheca]
MDKNLSNLLKWGIENTKPQGATAQGAAAATNDTDGAAAAAPTGSNLNPELLAALFGGPSEAELMKAAMELITDTSDPTITLDDRLMAFDNFEQLIESLDNANNLETLSLWPPLLDLLQHEEQDLRRMAAWCVGTAVQNNQKTQERLLARGGLPRLVHLATHDDEHEAVRRKAIYALSSAVRNYQPAMDVAAEELKKKGHEGLVDKVDASDMDAVDQIMNGLKAKAAAGGKGSA